MTATREKTNSSSAVRLAVVGCGAAAEHLHLPALTGHRDREVIALVDPATDRAQELALKYRVPTVLSNHHQLTDVDGAILTVPNHLHASVAIDLMRAGIAVLIEKPVARTDDEANSVQEVCTETGVPAMVGMELRFAAVNRAVKDLLDSNAIGPVESFSACAGVEFGWPVASSYIVTAGQAGGGVLIDVGVHVLDLLLWWLGDVDTFQYQDDSYGGVEADCLLHLSMQSGAIGTVELSRTRNLGHTITLRGEREELRISFVNNQIELSVPGVTRIVGVPAPEVAGGRDDVVSVIGAEHDDFLTAIRTGAPPTMPVAEARRSLALVEACYRQRELWQLPWVRPKEVAR